MCSCSSCVQNPSKASQSSRDTLSSGVHSWSSQAEARSSSCNMVLARGRPTDTPNYFNGMVRLSPLASPLLPETREGWRESSLASPHHKGVREEGVCHPEPHIFAWKVGFKRKALPTHKAFQTRSGEQLYPLWLPVELQEAGNMGRKMTRS